MAKKSKSAPTEALTDEFEFEDAGRTFTCSGEPVGSTRPDYWWWFRVSSDIRNQRYAPFRVEAGDTRESVQARIVAYYDDLLARRAAPPTNNHWSRRSNAPAEASPAAEEGGAAPTTA